MDRQTCTGKSITGVSKITSTDEASWNIGTVSIHTAWTTETLIGIWERLRVEGEGISTAIYVQVTKQMSSQKVQS